jgi:hypothetical protein
MQFRLFAWRSFINLRHGRCCSFRFLLVSTLYLPVDIDVQHFYYECGHKLHTQIDINIEVVQI